jgi:FcoT-like thioesterase domain
MGGDILMEKVLEVYFPQFRYLKHSEFSYPEIKGKFEIPSSFYVTSTGHFNGIEAILCYNQLAFTFFANSIEKKIPELMRLDPVSLEDFVSTRQLPDSYIAKINSLKFKRPIDSLNFYGELKLIRPSKLGRTAFLSTKINFWDDHGGSASGDILLAFVSQPEVSYIHETPADVQRSLSSNPPINSLF